MIREKIVIAKGVNNERMKWKTKTLRDNIRRYGIVALRRLEYRVRSIRSNKGMERLKNVGSHHSLHFSMGKHTTGIKTSPPNPS